LADATSETPVPQKPERKSNSKDTLDEYDHQNFPVGNFKHMQWGKKDSPSLSLTTWKFVTSLTLYDIIWGVG
jgi:hypothetical protein